LPFFLLPKVMVGIVSRPIMSHVFLHISPRRMWTLSRDSMITKPRLDQESKIVMFTIMWNPSGVSLVDRLRDDTKMNSNYFLINLFILFEQAIFRRGRMPQQKWLVIHLENGSVSTNRVSTNRPEEQSCAAYRTDSIHLIWHPVTSVYFLERKKSSNGFRSLTSTSFLSPCNRFRGTWSKELNDAFQAWMRRV
jgi:hypothetical protein